MQANPPLTHLSLFSGVGGLDIAAHWAGFKTVGFCEWSDYPHSILQKRFPNVPSWRDIHTLTKESFYAITGLRTATLISGGFPCQPFSCAGKRNGTNDDRYLWDEMRRVIEELHPDWVIGENVAGITSMAEPYGEAKMVYQETAIGADTEVHLYEQRERYLLGSILQDLERIGYAVRVFVVPAVGVGANHRRYRAAIVANAAERGQSGNQWREDEQQLANSGATVSNAVGQGL